MVLTAYAPGERHVSGLAAAAYYMQLSLHYSPVVSGAAFLPMIVMVVVSANLSNVVLLPRVGPRPLVAVGMLLAAGSLVWLTRIGLHSGYASAVLGPLMVTGLGFGLTMAPSMNTGTFGVAPQDAGVASATLNTGQQIGGSIGTSLLNTVFAGAAAHYLAAAWHTGTRRRRWPRCLRSTATPLCSGSGRPSSAPAR